MDTNKFGKIKIVKDLFSKKIGSRILLFGVTLIVLIISIICLINAIKWINKPFPGFLINQRMVVVIVQYHWTGKQAGLKFPDKILKTNDKDIFSARDLEEVTNNTIIGTPIRYSVARGEKVIEVTIPTMRFTVIDLLINFGIPFFSGMIYLFLGIVVFIMKPNTEVSWAFLLLCLFLGMYAITGFDAMATHLGFIRAFFLAEGFIPATFFHLSLVFPEKRRLSEKYPYLQLIPYIISTILLIPLELFYPGPLFLITYRLVDIYLITSAVTMLGSILQIYLKDSSVISAQRAKVVLFGSVIAFPFPALIIGLPTVLGRNLGAMQIPDSLLAIPIVAFPASIAYAIAKHNLFDVDVYIKRTVGFAIMTIIVGITYFSVQTIMDRVILRPILGESAEKVYPIIFALLVVFLFNPINRKVQEGVDRLFYRKRYDYKATIASVTDALTSLLDFDEIIKKVIGTVRNEMFIDTAGVIVLDPKKQACQTFFIGDGPNNTKDQARDIPASYDDPLIALLSKEKRLITRYDIAEDPKYKDMQGACGKRFQEIEATIAIPLIYQDKLTGLLALGNKKSGHFYTREDIDLLTTLASQGTIAIENAKLFKEHLEKGRMEEELKIAHDIQLSMLPDKAPEIEGFKIAARSIPAREVGGDFYDFIEIQGDGTNKRLGIVIGDVSGKGVSAALMMAASRSIYRVLADAHPSVEDLMSMGNKLLNRDIKKGMFVSLLYAELNPEGKILTLSNAGQTKPVICPGDRSRPFFIDTDGDKFPLGIIGDCKYQEKQVPLKEGDTIAFYTDGVVEAMNGKEEMYGFDRLLTSIEEGRGLDAEAMLEKLMNDISNFVRGVEQHDDLTLVVVKVG